MQGALKAYDSLLLVMRTLKPELRVLVAPILPIVGKTSYVTPFNAGVRKKVDSLAALGKNVTWVSEMATIGENKISGDAIHPFESTYPIMSSNWFQAITRVTDASSIAMRDIERRDRNNAPGLRVRCLPAGAPHGDAVEIYTVKGRRVTPAMNRTAAGAYITLVKPVYARN